MKTYRIVPLPTTKLEGDMGSLTYRMNHGTKIWVPIIMWYIEGADKQILVDSGASARFAKEFRGFEAEEIMSFDRALETVGLSPGDIDVVVQTHLHWDHCLNTHKCKNAKVLVQEDEIKYAYSPHPVMANLYHKPLFKDLKFVVIKGRHELEPGIEVIPAPGHTPGVQAVSVMTENGRAVISGFCSIKENFEPPEDMREMLPVVPTGIHTDFVASFDSALKIKGLADVLIPQHDPSLLDVRSIP